MVYKIMIHSMPAYGHINPILPVVETLVNEHKCHCIWYSWPKFRKEIERTGAEYRELIGNVEEWSPDLPKNKRAFPVGAFINKFLELNRDNSLNIATEIDAEKPDLIIFDALAYHVKWAIRYYEKNYKRAEKLKICNEKKHLIPTTPLPPIVCFETSFAHEGKKFPNKDEEKIVFNISKFEKLRMVFSIMKASLNVKQLSKEHDIKFVSPFDEIFEKTSEKWLRIVSMYPEFQPRHHLLSKNVKFIGACIDEKLRNGDMDENLKKILAKYPEVNPKSPNKREINDKALIYVSLGTVFNNNSQLFSKIIETLIAFKDCSLNYIKFENLDFIISAGKTYEGLISKYQELDKNILIFKSVPQLEILKRASLFVTHCGMNSVNEAIHYAVPIVCIPIFGDQPLVAHRASMELGIGITVDFVNMKASELKNAIETVFNDKDYHGRVYRISQESRKYNGKIKGAEEIIKFLS